MKSFILSLLFIVSVVVAVSSLLVIDILGTVLWGTIAYVVSKFAW